jgi:hypothetical protein
MNAFLVDSDSQTEVVVDQFEIDLQRHRMLVFFLFFVCDWICVSLNISFGQICRSLGRR